MQEPGFKLLALVLLEQIILFLNYQVHLYKFLSRGKEVWRSPYI